MANVIHHVKCKNCKWCIIDRKAFDTDQYYYCEIQSQYMPMDEIENDRICNWYNTKSIIRNPEEKSGNKK